MPRGTTCSSRRGPSKRDAGVTNPVGRADRAGRASSGGHLARVLQIVACRHVATQRYSAHSSDEARCLRLLGCGNRGGSLMASLVTNGGLSSQATRWVAAAGHISQGSAPAADTSTAATHMSMTPGMRSLASVATLSSRWSCSCPESVSSRPPSDAASLRRSSPIPVRATSPSRVAESLEPLGAGLRQSPLLGGQPGSRPGTPACRVMSPGGSKLAAPPPQPFAAALGLV